MASLEVFTTLILPAVLLLVTEMSTSNILRCAGLATSPLHVSRNVGILNLLEPQVPAQICNCIIIIIIIIIITSICLNK